MDKKMQPDTGAASGPQRKWWRWGAATAAVIIPLVVFGLAYFMTESEKVTGRGAGWHSRDVTRPKSAAPETSIVTASRIFAGPNQYPPEEFAAYGILAFRSRSSSYDHDRHLMICNAYLVTLPHVSELAVPTTKQMVTVWPIINDLSANYLNSLYNILHKQLRAKLCKYAIEDYGLLVAKQALKEAELAGVDTTGTGPFLLAWSPSTHKGKQDVLVLVSDLSSVTTYEQANEIFLAWSRDIERDPTLWSKGWNI